ncbi:aminodeoxychorismate lyase [Filibacter tadaridae]|uniref:Branched-chain-amino-acid aminotransferase n=1 Tax=Filibacter tadaridae TaxID=2483811 RepID=A0A3P5WS89_9BACL|nr:aminodeoxychorismate lyase [Filibacter tadaridae]VDC18869.1 Branched-chain-amino-acid aminotransferase [Filibacter tadaridae]
MWCWMNGEFVLADDLKISPFDHGFLYGVGFFETFRTYDGNVLLFDEHMDRLRTALIEFQITLPYEDSVILETVARLNELSGEQDGYFRLNVSAGVHDLGLAPSIYETPNVILFRKELVQTTRGAEKKAVWLETPRNRKEGAMRHKSHSFLNNVRGRLEVPSLKEVEGLFLTEEGFVAEGITSNVFWVKRGELFTPSIETGILSGTTRALVIEHAQSTGIHVNEGLYNKKDVETADEVFVTNAVQELVPLSEIGGIPFPGVTGMYYEKLHKLYVKAIDEMKEGGQW